MELGAITADLERAAIGEVAADWRRLNHSQFGCTMVAPVFALSGGTGVLGRWIRADRRLEIDRSLLFERSWTTVREVLKHEMAHQFVDEVLGHRHETAHGPAFRQVCAERGIDARAAGLPELEPDASSGRQRVIERVAKLLALAASANEHEAQTAMSAAQRLMLDHNIAALSEQRARRYVSRELGEPYGRLEQALGAVGALLAEFFFVEVIRTHIWRAQLGAAGMVLEVTGTPENVAMAEYVYTFLDRTADALWAQHKRSHRITSDQGRRAFRTGVIVGFRAKLVEERGVNTARGLVWVGDSELNAHHRRRYPHIRSRASRASGNVEARMHGERAGRSVVLSRPVEGGPSQPRGPGLLGDGRG